jgi:hypothetical protein
MEHALNFLWTRKPDTEGNLSPIIVIKEQYV